MNKIDIIAIRKPYLYTIKFKDEKIDVFETFMERWQDYEFINNFFEENKKYFYAPFWLGKDISEFRESIVEQLLDFEEELMNVVDKIENGSSVTLDDFFKPLRNDDFSHYPYQTTKAKNNDKPYCLRIYAVRLHSLHYVITGGAVKITPRMQDHELTRLELQKLEWVSSYLNDHFERESNPEPRYYANK